MCEQLPGKTADGQRGREGWSQRIVSGGTGSMASPCAVRLAGAETIQVMG